MQKDTNATKCFRQVFYLHWPTSIGRVDSLLEHFLIKLKSFYEFSLSAYLLVGLSVNHALTRVNVDCHEIHRFIENHYGLCSIGNEVYNICSSFTQAFKGIPLHFGLREKIICFRLRILMMIHYFKHTEICIYH